MANNDNQWVVHVYAVVRVPVTVPKDKATTPEEAIQRAIDAFFADGGLCSIVRGRPDDPLAPEDGEEITGFMVDHPDDAEYKNSTFYCADGKTPAWDLIAGKPRCEMCGRTK